MVRTFLSVIAAALLISIILFTPASADSGEARLLSGSSHSWQIELDQETRVVFDVEVEVGDKIDVYLMTASEYQVFQQGQPFTFIAEGSFTSTREASGDLRLGPGTYYLVATSPSGSTGAVTEDTLLSYSINVDTTSASSSLQTILTVGVAAIFCLVLLILFDVMVRRRSKDEESEEQDQQ